MNLFEIQSGPALAHIVDVDRSTARRQLYYRIIVLYGELLNSYARSWPKEEVEPKLKLAARQYVLTVWKKILELYLRALMNEGVIWHDKLIYSGLDVSKFATKVEGIVAVMGVHMQCGIRSERAIVMMISYHMWLKERLGIQIPT